MGEKMAKVDATAALMLILLGMFVFTSSLQLVTASGPVYIRADGSVDPPGSPLQRNGDLYTLSGNITSNSDGIVIEKGNIIIDGNGYTVEGGPDGKAFYVYGIDNVTVRSTRTEGFSYGIYLESTSRNIIYGNNLTGSIYDGIGLYDAMENIVSFNCMMDNGWSGVGLYFSSSNNISENSITDNYYGINMYGCENNSIFHNNFINNPDQISSDSSPNVWDNGYPSGGNYWSDYSGVDSNGDGIGDTPYAIDENNQDLYPLMEPWTNIGISQVTLSKNIIGQGYSSYAYVLVQNQGWDTVTVNIILYANTTPIIQEQVVLAGRSSVDVVLLWDSSGLSKGNYTISAYAEPVPGETDMADNTCNGGSVKVTIPGDVTGEGTCDMQDISIMIDWFMTSPPNWNPNCDVNNDLTIDMADVSIAIDNFMVS